MNPSMNIRYSTAWRYGLREGVSCVICCSAPVLALRALGAMNLAIMTVTGLEIAVEKLAPNPEYVAHCAGIAALAVGIVVVAESLR